MATPRIELRGISKTFSGIERAVPALADISFKVMPGEFFTIIGASGSGKSTLFNLCVGLIEPDAGEITLDGSVVSRPGSIVPPHARGIGMVFQRPALWPHLTVARHVAFGLAHWDRSEARTRVEEVMHLARLEGLEQRYPHQLSGGEAQRVALARALAPLPRILLLDEPLSNLDPELHEEMLRLIKEVHERSGVTLILVSHDPREAEAVCDHVLMMRAGRLVQHTPPLPD